MITYPFCEPRDDGDLAHAKYIKGKRRKHDEDELGESRCARNSG